jgi:hypothetical protein
MSERKPQDDAKKQRLAKALKANIAKRKAQAKIRNSPAKDPEKPQKD